ncbi:ammonium transporter [Stylonychia lemnae]|uniref:Ammonium transporter n=1 Tax=Stylonychia lemnae TaxID=5949 RepID=A0A078A1M9_STYLE|nr:ammonium transporter [Stylonychia lemnae]|eukprot:CDW76015.1 ammonium transporter [Stylonychia lemnae]
MKIGFALLETGSVRQKNTSNILLKNCVDFFVGVVVFYAAGYGLMHEQKGGFLGQGKFIGINFRNKDYMEFLFDYSFCSTSTTIVSGSMAERIYVDAYIVFSIIMTGFIYPICAGWAWGGGWLQQLGYHDYSGSGIVHLVGGVAGLCGTFLVGPRIGIFDKKLDIKKLDDISEDLKDKNNVKQDNPQNIIEYRQVDFQKKHKITFIQSRDLPISKRIQIFKSEYEEFKGLDDKNVEHFIKLYDQNFEKKFQYYSMSFIVSGGYLLWVCWLFFNGVAGKSVNSQSNNNIIQKTIMNTILSGSMSSLVVFLLQPYFMKNVEKIYNYNPVNIVNGLLGGLISITASCNNVENYGALLIGMIGGFVYIAASYIWNRLQIDDPLHASQLHGFCGLWGVLAVGIFDMNKGLIYTMNLEQLGIQFLGAASLIGWTVLLTFPYFYILKRLKRLRVNAIYEIIGLDALMHEDIDKFDYISDKSMKIIDHQIQRKSDSSKQRSANATALQHYNSIASSNSTLRFEAKQRQNVNMESF